MTTDQTPDLTERLERGRAQLLEAMSAVSEDRTCCGWAADWARTLHAEGGIWETLGRAVGWPTGNYDAWVWVSWDEAAALYGHAVSSAGRVPATAQTALRDRIRRVLCERDGQGALWGTDMLEPDEYGADADAVLAVLPAPADRAATLDDVDLTAGPCPLCPSPVTLHTPSGARAHFTTVHPERRITGRHGGPWPRLLADDVDGSRLAVEAAVPDRTGDETQAEPWLSDSARIGRTLIWSWSEIGKGEYGEGYRAAQAEARALLGGQRDADADAPAVGGAQQPTVPPLCRCGHGAAYHQPWCRLCAEDSERPPCDGHQPRTRQATEGQAAPVIAYGTMDGRTLLCPDHAPASIVGTGLLPFEIDDLEDGGVCTVCGVDVLIPQEQREAPRG
ncbi:hypothetical protein [Streptomyces sp. NPDC088812]|uniref:hypothetical protein n=1 Tax=Streptomyces sp. NPDC088812 TaxID=3365905 RepID=UPI0038126467